MRLQMSSETYSFRSLLKRSRIRLLVKEIFPPAIPT